MKRFLSFLLATLFVMFAATAHAYDGTTFDGLQVALDDTALFFGVVTALAVIVTGFFLGRRWLKRVG